MVQNQRVAEKAEVMENQCVAEKGEVMENQCVAEKAGVDHYDLSLDLARLYLELP